ncbi:hypothetical protein SAY87_030498 [Trapa incisa]|uniref:Dof-type domain-containing protein n=2 Tax=Trapa TaxID=22665 RepID=A0AAN7R2U7_TRANT|nr:hypothetical protein SAY87_030498 [Trapa incisa]KAK4787637.1 hypothetical protein SAY86_011470 [Trapa natans]
MAEASHGGKEATIIKLFGATIKLQEREKATVKIKNESKSTFSSENRHRHEQQSEEAAERVDNVTACPRCNSTDTKFCYFNNYNVNQPRHFCRGCQRYWTAGGTLRNVPIGAGRRKTKMLQSPTPSSADQEPSPISGGQEDCFLYEYSNNSEIQHVGNMRLLLDEMES